jgi:TPP-dependent pyruvate/acetoin dehydrogenase alpha subunit
MTRLLEEAIRQIEQLPEGEQDAAAGALLDYVRHMHEIRLTDEQIAEVRRRIADPNRKLLSLSEARARVERFGS